MRIEEIEVKAMLARILQAYPALKDEISAIDQAEQTLKDQVLKSRKPAQPVRVNRSDALAFYETVQNDMVTAYQISDIREEQVSTLLQAQVQGMRKIRPIVLLLSIPQEGFDVEPEVIKRIEAAAIQCLTISAPRGRGLEVFMGIYQQRITDSLLRREFF